MVSRRPKRSSKFSQTTRESVRRSMDRDEASRTLGKHEVQNVISINTNDQKPSQARPVQASPADERMGQPPNELSPVQS